MWRGARRPWPRAGGCAGRSSALAAALGLNRGAGDAAGCRVGVFSTGDELAEPGTAARPGADIYDANRFTLLALLAGLPARGDRSRHPAGRAGGDSRRALAAAAATATCC
jgi:molybdopterin molybdotransferase